MTQQATTGRNPLCYRCIHFYITHAPDHPYGCRAMGFKSLRLPCDAVRQHSGFDCQLFTGKTGENKKTG